MWRQGEHVTIIGMNGSGKTTLAHSLLDKRTWRIMLVTKDDDLTWRGWRTVGSVERIRPRPAERPGQADQGTSWRLYPPYTSSAPVFRAAFDRIWADGGWTCYVDEAYAVQHKGLEANLVQLLTQGRSKRISMVCGVQRPAWVSRFVFSEATHVFAFQCGDRRDLKALRDGIGDAFADAASDLKRYEYLYYHKVTRRMVRGTVRTLDAVLAA
jgi:energy-coupling factor transporter ATP-binding protein EcfA2